MISTSSRRARLLPIAAAALAATGGALLLPAHASSHREAPYITTQPKVDGTDFYMFSSYENGRADYVTLIANYQPLQAPYGGPNYFSMDPNALYEIHVDNNGDANEDITFQFDFDSALASAGNGLALMVGPTGNQRSVAVPLSNIGAITAGSAFDADQNVQETYTVKVVRGDREMIVQVYIKRGCLVPTHVHESEQMTYILQGALRVVVDGEEMTVREGEVLHIPSGVAHQAEALEDTFELDVFSPIRLDWLSTEV